MNPDKSATRSGLVGRYVTVLDLKASHSGALAASVRQAPTQAKGPGKEVEQADVPTNFKPI